MVEEALKGQIGQAVEKEQPIRVQLYALLSKSEEELNYIVTAILDKYQKEHYLGALYTAVKELALNGAKANIKRILFEEQGIDLDDDQDYQKGMALFRQKLSEQWIFEYANKAKDVNLYVEVIFNFNEDRIVVEVKNNCALSKKEDRRIREKFKSGSQFDNIAEFYLSTQDNTEGAGMGITLILMLLKAEGIDPHLFTIQSDYRNYTIAKLEFPLKEEHKTGRQRFEEEQKA